MIVCFQKAATQARKITGRGVWLKAVIPHRTSRGQDSTALPVCSQSGIIDAFFDRHLICEIY